MNSIDQIAEKLESLTTDYSKLLWAQYTTGFDYGVNESQQKLNNYRKDKNVYKVICDALSSATDPIEKRKAEILFNEVKEYHYSDKASKILDQVQVLENSIMDLINKDRVSIDGQELNTTEINKIFNQSDDRKLRQKAYEAQILLNKKVVDHGFIQLINLRKELAAACNFDSFVEFKLDGYELNTGIFSNWAELCKNKKSLFKEKTQKLANQYLNVDQMEAWDYSYLKSKVCSYNQSEVDLTDFLMPMAKTFSKFGYEINNLNLTFDIFPRKNKSEWGYNFPIEIGKDARVLANVSNRVSDFWVLMHETAHGVHFLGLDPNEKALNAGVSGIVAEGFANFFGDQVYSMEFLTEIFSASEAEKAFVQFKDLEKISNLRNFRSIVETLFDQQLYTHDIQSLSDINQLRYQMSDDLLGERSAVSEIPWAKLVHHTLVPIYLHNYILGDVMCDKMKQVFSRHNNSQNAADKPVEFGQFWQQKVLALSGRYPFLELYEKTCEEKLSIEDYLETLLK